MGGLAEKVTIALESGGSVERNGPGGDQWHFVLLPRVPFY
jgi:hypothetical protein